MSASPIRFGISSAWADSPQQWLERARRAEDEGYSIFLVPDHLGAFNPAAAIQAVASATGLRVGQFVLNNDLRHPVVVAQESATLDLLSDGRLEVGLGAGWNVPEYEQSGIVLDRPGVRIQRLEEAVQILKRLFAGEEVSFEGEHYTISDHTLEPAPPQGASMPILIGGNGDRLLGVAARHASIVGFTGFSFKGGEAQTTHFSFEGLADRVAHVRAEAGDRADGLEFNILIQRAEIGDDAEEIAERWAATEGARMSAEEILDSPFMLAGSVEEVSEQLLRLREELGVSYFTVFASRSEGFGAVVERLAGT